MPPIFKRDDRFVQGIYTPINKKKFIGKFAIFRSSLERKFFLWADLNPNVLEWGSENIIVPYISPIDENWHRYYVDNYVVLKEGCNIVKYLVEIKPFKQTIKPTISKRKKQSTMLYEQTQWVINQAKWEAAEKFANKKGYKFIKITEKELI